VATPVTQPFIVPYLTQILAKDQPTGQAIRFLGDQIAKVTRGATLGTLVPDQKPVGLSLKDTGTEFFSTDYARLYRWTGTAWEDSPDAPARFQIVLFAQAPEPPIGWAQCDGRRVTRSTNTGGVVSYVTPVKSIDNSLQFWVRL
jgi:hypothetical protein